MSVVRPIPIGFAITELGVGGAERALVSLACGIDRNRFAPHVVSLAPEPMAPRDELVHQLRRSDIPIDFLGLRSIWQLPWAVPRLTRYLATHDIRLVQSMLFHSNVLCALSTSSGTRHVAGLRVRQVGWLRRRMLRAVAGRFDGVVCVSESIAAQARRELRIRDALLRVIPNGCQVGSEGCGQPASDPDIPQAPFLLCVGRLAPQKGVDELVQRLPELFDGLPQHRVIFLGSGPLRDVLVRRVAQLGLSDRVEFPGWHPNPRLWMRAADLLVLPSRWEGMPNVLLEAMAEGKPVVARNVEGVAELLGPDSDRQLAQDWTDFLQFVQFWACHADHAQRQGQINRRRVAEHFAPATMVQRYQQLYAELLARQT